MPLTADQQAMLQLLLERGQSYADLASVLGVDEAEVRARARSALTELADADPDHEVGLTDYLLGQADPIGRADAVRHLKDDPADLALATELSQKLLLLAPQAELPRLPGEERRPRPRRAGTTGGSRLRIPARLRGAPAEPGTSASAADGGGAARESRAGISKRQTQLAVAVASGLVLVVVIVLAVTGAFSGGDEADSAPADNTTAVGAGARGFPLSNVQVDKSGNFQNAFTIRQGLQPLLPQTQAIYVTLARKEVVLDAIKTAVGSRQPILPVKGRTIFTGVVNSANAQRGVIPIPLQAAAGVEGTGAAALGVSKARQAIFELRLTGIEQPPKGSAYILWFAVS
jgi:hypothetical protein